MRTPVPAKALMLFWVLVFSANSFAWPTAMTCNPAAGVSDAISPMANQYCTPSKCSGAACVGQPKNSADYSAFKTKLTQTIAKCCGGSPTGSQKDCGGESPKAGTEPTDVSMADMACFRR